jgi:multicomponent Na+:H+ antiporter subunit D
VAASLVASVLTMFSMLKIWLATFWNEDATVVVRTEDPRWRPLAWVCAGMVAISLTLGLGAEPLLRLAKQASSMALDRNGYARAVLATGGKEVQP